MIDFHYFPKTDAHFHATFLNGEMRGCRGLELPEEMLEQIYFQNAREYYGID